MSTDHPGDSRLTHNDDYPSFVSIDSLVDAVSVEPSPIPDGWSMRNDQVLESPAGILLVEHPGDLSFPGEFAIVRTWEGDWPADFPGPVEEMELIATVRVTDPLLAIEFAKAADRWEGRDV